MTTLQKWLIGLLAAFGIGVGTGVVATKPSTPTTPTPPPVVDTTTSPNTTATAPSTPSGSYTPIVADSFAQYASTAALQAKITKNIGGTCSSNCLYTDGWYANMVSLDSSVRFNGHATMKLTMPGGTKTTPALWASLNGSYDIIWFRARVRFSPGFTTTGTLANTNNAFKILAWAQATYDGSGRLEIANTTQYQLYWNIQAKNTGTLVGGGKYALGPNITTEWTDGNWYDYVIKVDRSKGTTATITWWLTKDGSAYVLKGTTPESMNDGSPIPQVTSIGFSIEFNQSRAASQNQALWIGDWTVVDGTKVTNPFGVTGG